MRLIIKGDEQAARKAAEERGITLTSVQAGNRKDTVFAEADGQYRRQVIYWFCEEPLCELGVGGYGFDPGTLLLHD